MNWHYYTAR